MTSQVLMPCAGPSGPFLSLGQFPDRSFSSRRNSGQHDSRQHLDFQRLHRGHHLHHAESDRRSDITLRANLNNGQKEHLILRCVTPAPLEEFLVLGRASKPALRDSDWTNFWCETWSSTNLDRCRDIFTGSTYREEFLVPNVIIDQPGPVSGRFTGSTYRKHIPKAMHAMPAALRTVSRVPEARSETE